jgi:glycosyltransferase involved in cell wall biosynthesis
VKVVNGPSHTWLLTKSRLRRDQLAIDLATKEFNERFPNANLAPVVVLLAAYNEEATIGDLLERIPSHAHGLELHPLVVADGCQDKTESIAAHKGAFTASLKENHGQGVALRLGYRLALEHGARYVVTMDADGQNDPEEIPDLLAPLLAGEAEFVVASRRLGEDRTSNHFRSLGVLFFGWIMSKALGTHLTDTSNGYRAFRIEVPTQARLRQPQYQTAELIIEAAKAGWRFAEVPTVWLPRSHGKSRKGHDLLFGAHYAWVVLSTLLRGPRESSVPRQIQSAKETPSSSKLFLKDSPKSS